MQWIDVGDQKPPERAASALPAERDPGRPFPEVLHLEVNAGEGDRPLRFTLDRDFHQGAADEGGAGALEEIGPAGRKPFPEHGLGLRFRYERPGSIAGVLIELGDRVGDESSRSVRVADQVLDEGPVPNGSSQGDDAAEQYDERPHPLEPVRFKERTAWLLLLWLGHGLVSQAPRRERLQLEGVLRGRHRRIGAIGHRPGVHPAVFAGDFPAGNAEAKEAVFVGVAILKDDIVGDFLPRFGVFGQQMEVVVAGVADSKPVRMSGCYQNGVECLATAGSSIKWGSESVVQARGNTNPDPVDV